VPQAWLTLRTRDVSGISAGMYSVFTVGVALWLLYGWLTDAWPVVLRQRGHADAGRVHPGDEATISLKALAHRTRSIGVYPVLPNGPTAYDEFRTIERPFFFIRSTRMKDIRWKLAALAAAVLVAACGGETGRRARRTKSASTPWCRSATA
jgi:hypothetical protein